MRIPKIVFGSLNGSYADKTVIQSISRDDSQERMENRLRTKTEITQCKAYRRLLG